jgi:hypothetical protein
MIARGKPGWFQIKLQQMQAPGLYTLETVRNYYVSSQLINSKQIISYINSMIKQVIKQIYKYQITKLRLNDFEDEWL